MTHPQLTPVKRIVSGGQTGVDRAALNIAIALGIDHGGWCPRGRRAEDGVIPLSYLLEETSSKNYRHRTRRNVIDSDATLILFENELSGGTQYTYQVALQQNKPHQLIDLASQPDPSVVSLWLVKSRAETLNVAGPRESTAPGIGNRAEAFLMRLLESKKPECSAPIQRGVIVICKLNL